MTVLAVRHALSHGPATPNALPLRLQLGVPEGDHLIGSTRWHRRTHHLSRNWNAPVTFKAGSWLIVRQPRAGITAAGVSSRSGLHLAPDINELIDPAVLPSGNPRSLLRIDHRAAAICRPFALAATGLRGALLSDPGCTSIVGIFWPYRAGSAAVGGLPAWDRPGRPWCCASVLHWSAWPRRVSGPDRRRSRCGSRRCSATVRPGKGRNGDRNLRDRQIH